MSESRRTFLKKVALGVPALAVSCGRGPSAERPNIIFIMSDDHARNAISAYTDHLIRTPNIDRLAREGVRFDNAFVTNSLCAPSRAVILTGKYSHVNGLRDNRDRFDFTQLTFPQLLQRAGYQTFLVGKWHLKTDPVGFDFWRVLPGQGHYYNPEFRDAEGKRAYSGYVTDLITEFALERLESRDKSRPFFMMVHHKAPHRNWMPALRHLNAFEGREFPVPETFFDDYATRCPAVKESDMRVADLWFSHDLKLTKEYYGVETGTGGSKGRPADPEKWWEDILARLTPEQRKAWDEHYRAIGEAFRRNRPQGKDLALWKFQRYMQDYLACVLSVDESVGKILDYLDQHGLAENTVVMYTSDQGFFLGEHGWYDKRFMYEESFGTPFLVRYPRRVPAGQTRTELVLNLDFGPTMLDLAGVSVPRDMQGVSLVPLLEGRRRPNWRQSVYYHYYEMGWHNVQPHFGVRTDRYKLIYFYESDCWELYDLQEDPHEIHNLYGENGYEGIVRDLKHELRRLQEELGDRDALATWEL